MERPSEPLLREIVAHLPYVATIIDPECRLLWVNQIDPAVPLESVIGQPIDGSIHEDHRAAFVALVRDSFATGESGYREVRAFLRTEGWRWYGVQIVPIAGEGERRALMLGIDVTERREAIAAIEASEARFRAVTVALPEVLTVVDGEGRILQTNRPTPDEAFGASIVEYAAPEDRERVREALESLFAGAEPAPFDTRSAHDGRVYENRLLRLPPEGDEPRALCISLDVTERREADRRQRELEAQLIEAQKMESLGQLAGGVAHDFNNLLTAMLSQLSLAMEDIGPEHPAHADLALVEGGIERAAELTRQLLTFGRRQPHRPERIDLRELVEGSARLLRRTLPASISLEVDLGAAPAWIDADPGALEQVLLNLCVNARDAIEGEGRIGVAVEADEGEVTLLVEDDGAGMTPAVLARIYEPFFTTKEVGKGTGLGLSIVHGVVARHEGRLEVDSAPGEGSRFRVHLARAEPAPREVVPAEEPEPEAQKNRGTVLLAEDTASVRRVLARVLELAGFRVLEAVDGADALRVVDAHGEPIDAAVLDAMMPKLSGRDVYERLVERQPDLVAVFCTGYAADVFPPGYLEERGLRLLSKPFPPMKLIELLDDLVAARAGS